MMSKFKKQRILVMLDNIADYINKSEYHRKSDGAYASAEQYTGNQWCGPFGHANDGDWNVNCDGVIGIIPNKEFEELYGEIER